MSLQMDFTSSEVHRIAKCVGWKKLWDLALDHGPSVIKGMKNLVRVIIHPSKCPLCDTAHLDKPTLAEHVITNHTQSVNSWCTVLDSFTTMDPTFFSHVLCFFYSSFSLSVYYIHVMPGWAHST